MTSADGLSIHPAVGVHFITLLLVLFARAKAFGVGLEYSGYLRAGLGTNLRGGDQDCFTNPTVDSPLPVTHTRDGLADTTVGLNEFRFGNECSIYGEMTFIAHHQADQTQKSYFDSHIRLAFFPPGHQAYEDNDSDGRDINVVEAFIKAGNLNGSPLSYWIGKRFYRDADIYMNDWFYHANMVTMGAGVENIPNPYMGGTLAVAVLQQVANTQSDDTGRHLNQMFDLQLRDIPLAPNHKLYLWAGVAHSKGGPDTSQTPTVNYVGQNGALFGSRYRWSFARGFNDFAVYWGKGLLDNFSPGGQIVAPDVALSPNWLPTPFEQRGSQRLRFVDHLTTPVTDNLETHFILAYDIHDNGSDERSTTDWLSVGVHPVYFLSEYWQLAAVLGYSQVTKDTEQNADNTGPRGMRNLLRFTFGPQIAPGRSIWGRPILRFFYTYTQWNDANKGLIGGALYADKTSGHGLGFQSEVWF